MSEPLAVAMRAGDPVSAYDFAVAVKVHDEPGNYPNWHIIVGSSATRESTMTDAEAATWTQLKPPPESMTVTPASVNLTP